MSLALLLLATVEVGAPSVEGVTSLSCSVAQPDGKSFQLRGSYDGEGLRSNLSTLTRVEGVLAPAPGIFVISDGTKSYRWQLRNPRASQKIDALMTQYGGHSALLIIEEQRFIGRHWGRNLIGVGYCAVKPRKGGKTS